MRIFKILITLSLGTLILMIVGFYNGYPLVYSDTGTYIGSGFTKIIPLDRALPYGLFVRHSSLSFSLWLVVLTQNFITAYVIYEILKIFNFKTRTFNCIYFTTLSFLVLFTGIGWYTNQIMPDFFAPITILSIFVLLKSENLRLLGRIFLSLVLILSMISHFSHLIIGSVLMMCVLGFYFVSKQFFRSVSISKLIGVTVIVFSGWLVLPTINYMVEKKFILSKGSHVFLMGHLVDTGILEKFLKEFCTTDEYKDCKLCNFKDSLPNNLPAFLWSGNYIEGSGGYLNSEEEYMKIINATLTKPRYLLFNIWESCGYGVIQLTKNKIGDGLSAYNKDSPPYVNIAWRFPDELNNYSNSRQNIWNGFHMKFEGVNGAQFLILLISIFILIWIFTSNFSAKASPDTFIFLIFVLAGIVLNSFVTAGLNSPNDRFQARVVWILPLALILFLVENHKAIYKAISEKFITKNND